MSVTDLMANRYSERRFSPAPIEDEKLQVILAAGALAPTAENKQPQRILVVRGDEALAKMDKCTRCRFGAPVVLVLAYDMTVAARHPDVADFGMVDIAIVGDHMSLGYPSERSRPSRLHRMRQGVQKTVFFDSYATGEDSDALDA